MENLLFDAYGKKVPSLSQSKKSKRHFANLHPAVQFLRIAMHEPVAGQCRLMALSRVVSGIAAPTATHAPLGILKVSLEKPENR